MTNDMAYAKLTIGFHKNKKAKTLTNKRDIIYTFWRKLGDDTTYNNGLLC